MSRGDTQFDRDVEVDVDPIEDPVGDADDGGRQQGRLRAGLGRVISGRALLVALVATVAGAALLGSVVPLGAIGNLLGIFLAAFLYGTLAGTHRYLETGVSGGVVGGGVTLLGNLTLSLLGPGVPLVAVGFGAGTVAGLLGHYFGRDLRDGLTREI